MPTFTFNPNDRLKYVLSTLFVFGSIASSFANDGCTREEHVNGWDACVSDSWLLSERCNIDRVPFDALSQGAFDALYLEKTPVVIEGSQQSTISQATTRDALLRDYGAARITLSSANSISHAKRSATLADYIAALAPHDPDGRSNETFYLFGPESELSAALAPLLRLYARPPFAGADLAFSFGIGASASGVPFHVHGHGFSEVIHGRKRWLLYPPHHKPAFDPDAPSALWLRDSYPALRGVDAELLHECTIGPGDLLYFPSMWWHAVVNVGESVFVSSFAAASGAASPKPRRPFFLSSEL